MGGGKTNGLAVAPPPREAEDVWQRAARRVEESLVEVIEALLGPAKEGSLPHAKFLIEFSQAANQNPASDEGSGEIAKLLDDFLRSEPEAEPAE